MSHLRRPPVFRWILLGAGITVLALAGLGTCLAAVSSAGRHGTANATAAQSGVPAPAAATCSPQPCADADGFAVFVDSVQWKYAASGWAQPEAGDQFARVTVRFTNRAGVEKHADPYQFVLQDQQGVKHALVWAGDGWQAVNLTSGAAFGPKSIDFQVPIGTTGGVLVWTPDFHDHPIALAS